MAMDLKVFMVILVLLFYVMRCPYDEAGFSPDDARGPQSHIEGQVHIVRSFASHSGPTIRGGPKTVGDYAIVIPSPNTRGDLALERSEGEVSLAWRAGSRARFLRMEAESKRDPIAPEATVTLGV